MEYREIIFEVHKLRMRHLWGAKFDPQSNWPADAKEFRASEHGGNRFDTSIELAKATLVLAQQCKDGGLLK